MEIKPYTWRLPNNVSFLQAVGCLILLYPLLDLGPKAFAVLLTDSGLRYYLKYLIPFLSFMIFGIFSVFFAKRKKILSFYPIVVYAACIVYTQLDDELSYILSNAQAVPVSKWFPPMAPEITANTVQLILLIAAVIVALFCYLDKIPSFVGGILFSCSAVSFLTWDFYNARLAFNPVRFEPNIFLNAFYDLSSITVLVSFALCLFAFKQGDLESEPKHFSIKDYIARNSDPRDTVSYGFVPTKAEGTDE